VKTGELVESVASTSPGAEPDRDLLAALAGNQAVLDRAVAHKTRRVVLASHGVMQDQKAARKKTRGVALASILLVLLALGPFAWHIADDLIGGELIGDVPVDMGLWVGILCPALVAAALVAGWSRHRS
jgi:hypothetical protein